MGMVPPTGRSVDVRSAFDLTAAGQNSLMSLVQSQFKGIADVPADREDSGIDDMVENVESLPSAIDETSPFENRQVFRYVGLTPPDVFQNFGDAPFLVLKVMQNLQPSRVGHRFQDVRNTIQNFVGCDHETPRVEWREIELNRQLVI
jgi:hypothetical protein